MAGGSKVLLPQKYYLDYFRYLLEFVQTHYGEILNAEELAFIDDFGQLSEDSQCFFVRTANRRGVYMRLSKFNYEEITDRNQALQELEHQRFITTDLLSADLTLPDLFRIFTKGELLQCFSSLVELENRTLKKDILQERLLEELPPYVLIDGLNQLDRIFRQGRTVTLEKLKLMFFGNLDGDMAQFVVRDVGHGRFETSDTSNFKPSFEDRKTFDDVFELATSYQYYKILAELEPPAKLFVWYQDQAWDREQLANMSWKYFDKLTLKLAKSLEQQGLFEQALQVYQKTPLAPSRERQVRLLMKLNLPDVARAICAEVKQNPQNAEERYFADDFLQKDDRKRINRSTTDFINQAEKLAVVNVPDRVERIVLDHFYQEGFEGRFTENYLWRGLFGLVFWEALYNDKYGTIHNPLQRAPSDLYSADFYARRKEALHKRLDELSTQPDCFADLLQCYKAKEGTLNPFVGWHEDLLPTIEKCFHFLSVEQIGSILLEIARNPKENTKGFPDLFIWNETTYHFIEVKSPSDHLSSQQLFWMSHFNEIGIQAKILRLVWKEGQN